MRLAGLPVWTLVLVACAVAPFLIRAWIDAEQRRAKGRTASMLQRLGWTARSRLRSNEDEDEDQVGSE